MRRISPRVLDWAIVGCGALIFAGFALVTRAANEGQLESTLISPWHIPVYGGALLAAYLLLDSADPSPGTPWRRELPPGYAIAGLGLVLFAVGFVADIPWQAVTGSQTDIVALITPTHLLIFAGIAMIVLGPLLAPRRDYRLAFLADVPAVICAGLLLALLGGMTQYANPVTNVLAREASTQDLLAEPTEVWVMAADGSGQTRLTIASDEFANEPSWSADGSLIAYVRWRYVEGEDRRQVDGVTTDVVVAQPDGHALLTISGQGGWMGDPTWSPDGKRLKVNLFHVPAAGTPGASAAASSTPSAVAVPQANAAAEPAPATLTGREWDVATVSSDGRGKPADIESQASTDIGTSWSPDGTSLLVHSDRSGNWEIYRVDTTSHAFVNLTKNPSSDTWASWSPDGKRIVFSSERGDGRSHLWVMDSDGGNQTQLTIDGGHDWMPSWSPDGTRIAFISNRDGNNEIYVMNADGSHQVDLTRSPQTDDWISTNAWSPDSDRIIYAEVGDPAEANPLTLPLGAASFVLQSLLLVGLLFIVGRLRQLPTGAVTAALTISVAVLASISNEFELIPAAFLAGALAELLTWWARRRRLRSADRLLAFSLPALLSAAYFVALAASGGVGWSLPIVISIVGLSGATGLATSYLMNTARPREPAAA
jgi:Tol biopolymer transport system component